MEALSQLREESTKLKIVVAAMEAGRDDAQRRK
jgi:hypothetical protein